MYASIGESSASTADAPARARLHELSRLILRAVLPGCVCFVVTASVLAQEPVGKSGEVRKSPSAKEDLSLASAKVDIKPVARDEEIRQRLQSILAATDWFKAPQVQVKEGVVFLDGGVASDELKKWAGDLARNTQDVAAVVNRMEVLVPSI